MFPVHFLGKNGKKKLVWEETVCAPGKNVVGLKGGIKESWQVYGQKEVKTSEKCEQKKANVEKAVAKWLATQDRMHADLDL